MLKVTDLKVNYGGIEAVKGISFEVPEKSIVTLIGANGAGKSTTLRSISGLVRPGKGRIEFLGEDITGKSPEAIVKRGITMVPEGRKIFADLTVCENLKIGAYLRKDKLDDDIDWVYSLFPRLKERTWQLGGTLSGGEQQMLAVGRALMSRPKLMMMDEPSLGLAPIVVRGIFDIIRGNPPAGHHDPSHRAKRQHGAPGSRYRLRHGDGPHHPLRRRQRPPPERRRPESVSGRVMGKQGGRFSCFVESRLPSSCMIYPHIYSKCAFS